MSSSLLVYKNSETDLRPSSYTETFHKRKERMELRLIFLKVSNIALIPFGPTSSQRCSYVNSSPSSN